MEELKQEINEINDNNSKMIKNYNKQVKSLIGAAQELKAVPNPPSLVTNVCQATLSMLGEEYKENGWKEFKVLLKNPKQIQSRIQGVEFDPVKFEKIDNILKDENMTIEKIKNCSAAAADFFLIVQQLFKIWSLTAVQQTKVF